MDACLIAAGQRAEHYEMAAYGTLIAWAKAMDHSEAAALLAEILDQEKAADAKLTELAAGGINQQAANAGTGSGWQEDESEENEPNRTAKRTHSGRKISPSRRTKKPTRR
jgi:acyl-homoserine lactone acylase PvdQ